MKVIVDKCYFETIGRPWTTCTFFQRIASSSAAGKMMADDDLE